jgi:hypothetical protein
MNDRNRPADVGKVNQYWHYGAVFALFYFSALALAFAWFWTLEVRFDTFTRDDLQVLIEQEKGEEAATAWQALAKPVFGRYRPASSLALWSLYKLTGDDFRARIIINTFIHSLFCAGLGFALWRLARAHFVAAWIVALLAVISRFAFYHTTQAYGIMEIMAAISGTITVGAGLLYLRTGDRTHFIALAIAFAVCINSHERFIVLAPFVALVALGARRPWQKIDWLFALLPLLVVGLNIATKEVLLEVSFLTVSTGTNISLQPVRVAEMGGAGLASIFGYNQGPMHFSGIDFREPGSIGIWAFVFVLAGTVVLLALRIRQGLFPWFAAAMLAGSAFLLVLIASIAERQEFRWLYMPELILLGSLAVLTRADGSDWIRRARLAAFLVAAGGLLWANVEVRRHANNLFFIGWLKNAESARKTIIDGARSQLDRRPVYVLDADPDPLFFPLLLKHYAPEVKSVVKEISSRDLEDLPPSRWDDSLFFKRIGGYWEIVPLARPAGVGGEGSARAFDVALIPDLESRIVKAQTDWVESMRLGLDFMERSPATAERHIRHAVVLSGGSNPYPYFYLGQLLMGQKRYAEATASLRLAVAKDDPLNPNRYFNPMLATAEKELALAPVKP